MIKKEDKTNNTLVKEKKNKFKIWIALIMALVIIVSFFCGFFTYRLVMGKKANSVSWAISMIEKFGCYYDEESGSMKEYSEEDYIKMITSNLDAYSTYYTKEEYSAEVKTSKGNNYGVGITSIYDSKSNKYEVYRIVWNSPAEKSGLKNGDILVAGIKNGTTINFDSEYSPADFVSELSENEVATFIIDRNDERLNLDIQKSVYIANYVKYVDSGSSLYFSSEGNNALEKVVDNNGNGSLDDNTAMISLYLFEGNAKEGIKQAMEYLNERKKSKLIFDLRNNGGGFMDTLIEIASYFISVDGDEHPVIAIAKDNDGDIDNYKSNGDNFNKDIKQIVVLANENTASASECLIGAMLYYKCSFSVDNLIIEKHLDSSTGNYNATTYGKGIMQTTYKNIFTGEAIKLTTATIFQPDGVTTIHGKGITTTELNSVEKGEGLNRALEILK